MCHADAHFSDLTESSNDKFSEWCSVELHIPLASVPNHNSPLFVFVNCIYGITGKSIFGCVIRQAVSVLFPNSRVNSSDPDVSVIVFVNCIHTGQGCWTGFSEVLKSGLLSPFSSVKFVKVFFHHIETSWRHYFQTTCCLYCLQIFQAQHIRQVPFL